MMLMTMNHAQELGNALLDAAEMLKKYELKSVSVEIYNGRAVAVHGGASDHTIIMVIETLDI